MECYCYLRNVQDLLADGKTPYQRRFGESFKERTRCTIWCTSGIPSNIRKRSSENSSIWQESITREFSGTCFDRGRNLEMRHPDCWYWRIGKYGRIRNISWKMECKRSLDNSKKRRNCISCGRWFSKIVERDYEFQEPTLRREQTVRREKFSGHSPGEAEESQPTDSRDDIEARRDFSVYPR